MAKTKKFNRIKDILAEKGKTQTWLAQVLDKDFVTVNRYVNNNTQPSLETLFKIAKSLGVNPKDLLNS